MHLLNKLQKAQNAAARLVCKAKKSDCIHPILQTLHWLPIAHRVQYKISTVCFSSLAVRPHYLSDLLQPYTPTRQLRSASDTHHTFMNMNTFGERSFLMQAPLFGTPYSDSSSSWNRPQNSSFSSILLKHKHVFVPTAVGACACVFSCTRSSNKGVNTEKNTHTDTGLKTSRKRSYVVCLLHAKLLQCVVTLYMTHQNFSGNLIQCVLIFCCSETQILQQGRR